MKPVFYGHFLEGHLYIKLILNGMNIATCILHRDTSHSWGDIVYVCESE